MAAHIHRDLRPLVRAARAAGWTVDHTRRGHLRLTSPTGAVVVTGGTPSDFRAPQHLRSRRRKEGLPC